MYGAYKMDSLVRFSETNQAKTFEFKLTLSKEQNLQLIKRLDLLSLKKVSFMGNLSPLAEDRWVLEAKLRATVKQKCVITLKPVQTIVSETVNRTFAPLDVQKGSEIIDDGASPVFFDDTLQEFNDTIDLLEIIFEELTLILPLYPKCDGVKSGPYTITEPGKNPLTEENLKPFAQLSKLKDKLEKNK